MIPAPHARPQRLLAAVLALAIVLAALAPSVSLPVPFARAQDEPIPSGDVIVVLEDDATRAEVRAEAAEEGVQPDAVFTEVIDAFAADVTQAEADALAADPDVAGVFPNSPVYAAAQTLPTGVDRIDADQYPLADIDRTDDARVDVDIAILDSGIDGTHADLNVVDDSGVDCQDTAGGFLVDDTGHGTHVAGIAAAIDNDDGVVGVAPGARLHSVKVLERPLEGNSNGEGTIEDLICGLEWVVLNAGVIDVVNMSISGDGVEGPACGATGATPLHTAVCATVDAGIPVIVAAGNGRNLVPIDADRVIPATYPEVIAVSSVTDANGRPGGGAAGCGAASGDDRVAYYSNFGADIDIAAPGGCILSTKRGGGSESKSGTSMAAPHVAGAAGLYLAVNPGASPDEVRGWLLTTASQPQNSLVGFTGDRDDVPEPFLWLGDGDQPTMTPSPTQTSTPTATSTPIPASSYPLAGGGRSPQSASYTYIRDRNLDTSWITKPMSSGPPAGAFVYTDLGSPKPIGTVRWIFKEYGYADVFRVEASNDLQTWTLITRRNGKPPGAWHERQLDVPVTGRYVRFFFENPKGDLQLGGLAEVEVWSPGQAPPFPTATPTVAPPATSTRVPTSTPTPVIGGGGEYAIVDHDQSSNALDAGLAHDGNELTSWRTAYGIPTPASAEAIFEISSVQLIGSIRWVFNVGGRADAFTIAVSDDGAFWETVHSGTNSPSGVWQQVGLPSGTTGKLVRFRFANPKGDAVLGSLAEVEVNPPLGGSGFPDPEVSATATATATVTGTPSETPTGTPSASPTSTAPASPTPTVTPVESVIPPVTDTPSPTLQPTEPPADASPAAIALDEPTTVPETETPSSTPASAPESPTPVADPETATPTLIPTVTDTLLADVIPVVGVRRSANTANGWTALDGDPATVWRTTATPPGRLATLTLDLGDPTAVAALRILIAEDGFGGALTVEASDDLVGWTAVATPAPADLLPGEWTTLALDAPVTTRYLRLVVVNPGDLDTLGGVAELEPIHPGPSAEP